MKTISTKEFKNLLKKNNNFQIIDIREPYEYEDGALTNENIPLDKMMSSLKNIQRPTCNHLLSKWQKSLSNHLHVRERI